MEYQSSQFTQNFNGFKELHSVFTLYFSFFFQLCDNVVKNIKFLQLFATDVKWYMKKLKSNVSFIRNSILVNCWHLSSSSVCVWYGINKLQQAALLTYCIQADYARSYLKFFSVQQFYVRYENCNKIIAAYYIVNGYKIPFTSKFALYFIIAWISIIDSNLLRIVQCKITRYFCNLCNIR